MRPSRGFRNPLSSNNSRQTSIIVSILLGCLLGFSISRWLQRAQQLQQPECVCHEVSCPHSGSTVAVAASTDASQDVASFQHSALPEVQAGSSAQPQSTKSILQSKFAQLPRLDQIPAGSNVFLTFSNGHYSKLMLNAAALVADLGYPVIVLTFDKAAEDTCREFNIPSIRSSIQMDTADFRQDRCSFLMSVPMLCGKTQNLRTQ
jgi:hypothetical protein